MSSFRERWICARRGATNRSSITPTANQAAEEILGANPLVGFDRAELFDALGRFAKLLAAGPGNGGA